MNEEQLQAIITDITKSLEDLAPALKTTMETLGGLIRKVDRLEERYDDKLRRLEAEVYKQGQPND